VPCRNDLDSLYYAGLCSRWLEEGVYTCNDLEGLCNVDCGLGNCANATFVPPEKDPYPDDVPDDVTLVPLEQFSNRLAVDHLGGLLIDTVVSEWDQAIVKVSSAQPGEDLVDGARASHVRVDVAASGLGVVPSLIATSRSPAGGDDEVHLFGGDETSVYAGGDYKKGASVSAVYSEPFILTDYTFIT